MTSLGVSGLYGLFDVVQVILVVVLALTVHALSSIMTVVAASAENPSPLNSMTSLPRTEAKRVLMDVSLAVLVAL